MNALTMPGHAIYSPSSAHRWTVCTASAEAIGRLGEQEEGDAAKKGTAAHSELESVLGGNAPDPNHASAYAVALAVAYVKGLPPGTLWIEQRVSLTEQIWGRLDVGHWFEQEATLTIVDLKDGFVDVSPVENDQERIYAAALIREHGLKARWIRYVIVQPNSIVPGPRVKQWVEPAADLEAWAQRVAAIPNGPLTFKAGSHCRYCPLFGRCEPTRDLLAQLSVMLQHTPEEIRPDQVQMVLALKRPVEDWFKGLDKAATKAALAGNIPPGGFLVTAVKHRAWRSEADARAAVVGALGVDVLELPTPAQAEKLGMDKEAVAQLAEIPEGSPVLAFGSDKRKPWTPKTSAQMFAGIPGLQKETT
jgi:Protein of unknown function (DUF2800)